MGVLEMARIKIDWEKTEERMKAVGFRDEEIKKLKENVVEMFIRYLDEGKEVPIILRGSHTLIDIKSKTLSCKPLFPITLKRLHEDASRDIASPEV